MTELEQARRASTVVILFIALSAVLVRAYRAARRPALGQSSQDGVRKATTSASDTPKLEIGGPTSAGWREEVLARAEGLRFLEDWIRSTDRSSALDGGGASIDRHLAAAKEAATGAKSGPIRRTWRALAGSPFERALANLDMAEVDLLRLAPEAVLEGAQPGIQAHVNRFLAKDDPRRLALDELTNDTTTQRRLEEGQRELLLNAVFAANSQRRRNRFLAKDDLRRLAFEELTNDTTTQRRLEEGQRELLLNALFAANSQRRRNLARVRSFRNMLRGGIVTAIVLAIGLAVIGFLWQDAIPLCFTPETDGAVTVACPQRTQFVGLVPLDPAKVNVDDEIAKTVEPGDILLVEFAGFLGAAVSVVALFRRLKKGTSTPYNVPFSLAILKLPTGAVSAVAGLLLMRADFVPGLSALDTPEQILGWALVFGIAQHLVTRLADNRADALLEDVGGRGAAGDRPLATRAPD